MIALNASDWNGKRLPSVGPINLAAITKSLLGIMLMRLYQHWLTSKQFTEIQNIRQIRRGQYLHSLYRTLLNILPQRIFLSKLFSLSSESQMNDALPTT